MVGEECQFKNERRTRRMKRKRRREEEEEEERGGNARFLRLSSSRQIFLSPRLPMFSSSTLHSEGK
jgi:hypothetical protein